MDRFSIERTFELRWRLGARTATLIAETACRFSSEIELSSGAQSADGKSIFSLMTLGPGGAAGSDAGQGDWDLQPGMSLRVVVSGADATAAMGEMERLFTRGERLDRCIEPGCRSTPCLTGRTADSMSYGCAAGHAWTVGGAMRARAEVAAR